MPLRGWGSLVKPAIMKKLFLLPIFALALCVTSCGDDDFEQNPVTPEDPETSLIEGVWMCKFRNTSVGVGVSFYVFNNDGTGYDWEFDDNDGYVPGGIEYMYPCTYYYDKDDNTLLMYYDDGRKYVFSIRKLTAQQLIWINPDGDVDTFVKYNGDIDDIEREYKVTLKVKL